MTDGASSSTDRERRLAEALRANLRRRKAQAKGRRAGSADERAGIGESGTDPMDAAATLPPESNSDSGADGQR